MSSFVRRKGVRCQERVQSSEWGRDAGSERVCA